MFIVRICRTVLIIMTLALALAACGGTAATTTMGGMESDHDSFAFGEPAVAANADRAVEMTADNDLRFTPAEITVAAGETITFRVTNTGSLTHDFILGDAKAQEEHEAEMTAMRESGEMMMHDEANSMTLPPGETKELTWHFTESGSFLIGCHQKGHYDQGMHASVTVG